MLKYKNNSFLMISLLSFASCGSALAFESQDDNVVTNERESAAYAQQGIHAGAFTILPKLDFTNEYNSNIYYRDKSLPITDSYVAHFKPGLVANSNWSRHALNLNFDTDLAQYASQGDQNNYNDLRTRLSGRLDVTRDSYFDGGFAYNSIHESRGSPDQIVGKGPTFYDTKVIDAFYIQKLNRMSVKAGIDTIRYDYDNVLTSLNIPLLMSTRNHWEYVPSIRLAYEIQSEYEAFIKFSYKQADYDTSVYANGVPTPGTAYNRNSTGYNALGGLAFDLTDLITGDMSVGYLQRSYVDARLSDISGVNGFVNLKWRPTALTTVVGKVSRDINETTQQGVAGVLATGVSLGVEHELMRNVILSAGGNFTNNDYQGFVPGSILADNTNRNDNIYGGTVGGKYLLNRNFSTNLSYTYSSRDTNYLYNNYQVNQVMLNFRGQF